jgi:hypothetical protein
MTSSEQLMKLDCCFIAFEQVAESTLSRLQQLLVDASLLKNCRWRMEQAELFWARGELESAKYLLKKLITDCEEVMFVLFMHSVVELMNQELGYRL